MEQDDLVKYVYERLARAANRNDLIMEVCQRSGRSWPDAERYVLRVSDDRRRQIARRLVPFVLFISGIALVGGGYLSYEGFLFVLGGPGRLGAGAESVWGGIFPWLFVYGLGYPTAFMGAVLVGGAMVGVFCSVRSLFE